METAKSVTFSSSHQFGVLMVVIEDLGTSTGYELRVLQLIYYAQPSSPSLHSILICRKESLVAHRRQTIRTLLLANRKPPFRVAFELIPVGLSVHELFLMNNKKVKGKQICRCVYP
jgi:hypothetical protein